VLTLLTIRAPESFWTWGGGGEADYQKSNFDRQTQDTRRTLSYHLDSVKPSRYGVANLYKEQTACVSLMPNMTDSCCGEHGCEDHVP
jgi:hypothetical protein